MEAKNFLKILVMATIFYYSAAHHRRRNLNDFSSNVIVEETVQETDNSARFSKLVEGLLEQNKVPEYSGKIIMMPSDVIERTSRALIIDGFDPFYLNDLEFQVSSRSIKGIRYNSVLLDGGKLFGTSDFRCIDDPKAYKDQRQMYLIWNRLRASYTVTVNKDGLKNFGEIDIRIGRLTMHVQLPKSSSKSPRIEMSEVDIFETKLSGLDMISEDMRTNIRLKTESKIKNFINGKLRNVLLNYVQTSLKEDFVDNRLSPLLMPREYIDDIL